MKNDFCHQHICNLSKSLISTYIPIHSKYRNDLWNFNKSYIYTKESEWRKKGNEMKRKFASAFRNDYPLTQFFMYFFLFLYFYASLSALFSPHCSKAFHKIHNALSSNSLRINENFSHFLSIFLIYIPSTRSIHVVLSSFMNYFSRFCNACFKICIDFFPSQFFFRLLHSYRKAHHIELFKCHC